MENYSPFDEKSWDEFCASLQEAGQQILANTPNDGLDKAEGFRYLARLTHHSLARFIEKPQPLRPIFSYNAPKIGGDNPDYLYGSATISGRYEYIIRGKINDAFNIGIGSYYGGLGSGKGLLRSGYLTLSDLKKDEKGNFKIIVSKTKQGENWLPLFDESNSIMIRQTMLERQNDEPADLKVELLNPGSVKKMHPKILSSKDFETSLQTAGLFIGGVVNQFINWTNTFRENPNKILTTDPKLLQFAEGDPNTLYYNGYFDLAEGEALEVTLDPPVCEYWNLQVTNYWLESLDYFDYNTNFNHSNAKINHDGKVIIVISKKNPGVDNWIDTAGHDRGCISMRWIKADNDSQPKTRLIKTINQAD